ncbi:MAG: hypothetical protein L3J65_11910 [Robiginitomaculum sp.]|nr:hypothetical protein [Robiginitomaculum sp.]
MDTLKWLLNASLLIAFMFLGLKAEDKKNHKDGEKSQKSVMMRIIG